MIHITVRGGVVVDVATDSPVENGCVVTDYDNQRFDQNYFFTLTEMKRKEAKRLYKKATSFGPKPKGAKP